MSTEMLAPFDSLLVRLLASMSFEQRSTVLKCFCTDCWTCLARFDKEGSVQGTQTGPLAFLDKEGRLCLSCKSLRQLDQGKEPSRP